MQAAGVMALTWRPIAGSDVDAWAELLRAAEAVDRSNEHYDADDLAEELVDPGLDASRDTIAAWAGDRLIAYGLVRGKMLLGGGFHVNADGCVHPEFRRRGIGTLILRGAVERAAQLHAEHAPQHPAELVVSANDRMVGVRALAEASGLRAARWWYEMERDLTRPVEQAPAPQGLRLRRYEAAVDEQLRLAHNDAFTGHWGSSERSPAMWRQWVSGSRSFRPDESMLAWDGDQIAGYVLIYEYEADTAATGVREAWLGLVGTRPPWRGRGVASALMSRVLAGCAERGYQRASLGVDTGNQTGALGLYQRAGFEICERGTNFVLPIG